MGVRWWPSLLAWLRAFLRCAMPRTGGSSARGCSFQQEPQGAVYRFRIAKHASELRLDENQIRPCDGLAVVLAVDPSRESGKIVLRTQVVISPVCRCLLHTVCALSWSPFGHR